MLGLGQMTTLSQNNLDFAARVARIESGAAASKQLLFVGVDEVYKVPLRVRKGKKSGIAALIETAMYPVSMVLAVAIGAVSHGIGQIVRFQVQGMPDLKANPDIEMTVQLVLGICIAMVLGYLVGLRSNTLTTLKSAGSALGVLFFHNAVHMYPHVFAVMTSTLWVNQIVSHTQPHSMLWRGISFML